MAGDFEKEARALQYLARAREAREIARTVKDPETRKIWEGIADGWEQLARQFSRGFFPATDKHE